MTNPIDNPTPDLAQEARNRADQIPINRNFAFQLADTLKDVLLQLGWVRYRENELQSPRPEDIKVDDPETWASRRAVRFLFVANEAEITVLFPLVRGQQVVFNGVSAVGPAKFRIWGPPSRETPDRLLAYLTDLGVVLPKESTENR